MGTAMKTSTVEVGEILAPLSAAGFEKQPGSLPGVHRVDVNYVAASATVHYDEAKTSLEAIRQRVIDCGYHCRGELRASHVCEPVGGDIAKLQERGVRVALISGDNQATAERIGKELGIDIVMGDVLPGDKAAKVKVLQDRGDEVGMVGDGVNDAPALTQADVGFAIDACADVAKESARVVLMKSDPYDVVGAIELSRATLRKMHQNLWWVVGYNVVAFPLAAGVLYPFGLSPEVAALPMSGSSAIVAINPLMLKRTKLADIKSPGRQADPDAEAPAAARAQA